MARDRRLRSQWARVQMARISDSKAIRDLEQRIWAEVDVTGRYEIGPLVRFGLVYVARRRGKVIGAILGCPTLDGAIHVSDWVVEPEHRRKGVGRALYRRLIHAAGRRHLVTFIGPRQLESLAAHRAFGFRILKRVRDPYGLGEHTIRFLLGRDPDSPAP